MVPATYSPDAARGSVRTVVQAGDTSHYTLTTNSTQTGFLGKRKLTEVRFPSTKVQMHEDVSRHSGKTQLYYAWGGANFPVLFFDQHARMVNSDDVLPGFQPGNPRSPFPTTVSYDNATAPQVGEPELPTGATSTWTNPIGKCRWTRAGLLGNDIATTQSRNGGVINQETDTSGWY
jgi:hypothetical protein